jgi:excisionase family DNA binding protein
MELDSCHMRHTQGSQTYSLDDRQLALLVGLCVATCTEALRHAATVSSALSKQNVERASATPVSLDANTPAAIQITAPGSIEEGRQDDSHTPVATTKLLVTVGEAAQMLGIGRSLMYELVSGAEVASVKIGGVRRIPMAALDEFVNRQLAGSSYGGWQGSTGSVNGPRNGPRKERDDERQTRQS